MAARIGQQHVVEEVSEEEPLRNFAGGADRRRGLRRLGSLARFEQTGGAGGRAVTGLRLRCGGDGRHLVDDDGAHAGEVESAEKRSDGQLAGLAEVHQELHHGGADLAELARELVGAGLFGGIGFAAEEFGPGVGQGMEEAFEIGGQARRLLFAVDAAGAHIAHRDGGAQAPGWLPPW